MEQHKKNISIVLVSIFLFYCSGCNSIDPDIYEDLKLGLSVEDVSCTEAWLKIMGTAGSNIILNRDNKEIMKFNLISGDTTIVNDSLLPNKSYSYQLFSIDKRSSSNKVSAITMDTTSHNFTWNTYLLGDETSVIYDVAIINENNIWAVGEIYLKDSLGNTDPVFYNLVKWDGIEWKYERIFYVSQNSKSLAHLKSIYSFDENSIILGGFILWNGSSYKSIPLNISYPSMINKIWGTSYKDFFIVGDNGKIANYKNGFWVNIESNTTSDLRDIYGDEQNIFIAGYYDFKPSVLLKLKGQTIQKIIEDENNLFSYRSDFISGAIKSVWVKNGKVYTLTRFDLYLSGTETDGKAKAIWKRDYRDWGMLSVRGNNINDVITCGAFGRIWHYNGITWQRITELEDNRDRLYRIEFKENISVAVGYRYENGIERYGLIHIGNR